MGLLRRLSNEADGVNIALTTLNVAKMRHEQAQQRDLENAARAKVDPAFAEALAEQQAQLAARGTRRAPASFWGSERPIVGLERICLWLLAVGAAMTVVGLPFTVYAVRLLRRRSPRAIAARQAAELDAVTLPIDGGVHRRGGAGWPG